MIYTLVHKYGKTRQEAENMTEYDFTFIVALENLNVMKEKYLYAQQQT